MNVLFINPPHSNPIGPTLGPAVLASHLKYEMPNVKVSTIDLGLDSIYYLLSNKIIESSHATLSHQINELESGSQLEYSQIVKLKRLVVSRAKIESCQDSIQESLDILKNFNTYSDYEKRTWAIQTINDVLEGVSFSYDCSYMNAGDYRTRYSPFSSKDLISYINAENTLYREYFQDWLDKTSFKDINIVGISISFAKQVLPSLLLASFIKEKYPNIFILVGGSMMAHMNHSAFPTMLSIFDAIVQREGEYPICRIIKCLEKGDKLSPQCGAFYLDANGNLVEPTKMPRVSSVNSQCPIFDGIDFSRYIIPSPVVPLQISRQCYWGKCTFCCLNTAYEYKDYRHTSEQVVNFMSEISSKYGISTFEFIDDAIAPSFANVLSDMIMQHKLNVSWFAYARLDSGFSKDLLGKMYKSGCVGLKFGLESASESVLKAMNKGIDLEIIPSIISNAQEVGMCCQVAFFVGFPTETESDRNQTIEFIKNNVIKKGCAVAYNGWFRILNHMPIIQDNNIQVKKWNLYEDLIDYYINTDEELTYEYMQKFNEYLCEMLVNEETKDIPRGVDNRRYWFGGRSNKISTDQKYRTALEVFSHYDITIPTYQDCKFDDFRPGKGIYSDKSYLIKGLLSDENMQILNSHIKQNKGAYKKYIIKGDEVEYA